MPRASKKPVTSADGTRGGEDRAHTPDLVGPILMPRASDRFGSEE